MRQFSSLSVRLHSLEGLLRNPLRFVVDLDGILPPINDSAFTYLVKPTKANPKPALNNPRRERLCRNSLGALRRAQGERITA